MSEKCTLSQWLRHQEVYQEGELMPAGSRWRDALLADFEHGSALPVPAMETADRAPLQFHHLAMMAPAGLGLFGLGWLFGHGVVALDQLVRISPLVWMGCAVVGSLAFLLWRRTKSTSGR